MKKNLTTVALALALTLPLAADDWSLGAGSGAFVFGDFVERTLRPTTGEGESPPITLVLSAATRPGLSVDIERSFAPRWAVRLEGAFTHAPLKIKDDDDDGVALDAGNLDVTTFALPIVFHINTGGAFRFHIMGGPAYAIYKFESPDQAGNINVAGETRRRWGGMAGAGLAWWTSDRFAIEANISDIVTSSPFSRDDFPDVPGFHIPRPHNVHTTVGGRWKW
jgi:hypothetical protein